ncbi:MULTISPECIES: MurR/RpiR family transcriptional regulator [Vibrio]|uniref:SIS domain-containing protein n=1 Tax=Vibrio algicola TaxID=2662262 RepID=A0A5Q0TIB5_9VIBR|nr:MULTISPECIES: SIS domain-containing protein [Vibrio]MBD1574914.1 SIS domain-containing protein [Vibrio sp. S11_S32]
MSLLTQLRYNLAQFSTNEQKIAHHLLSDPFSVLSLSSQKLANQCEVSQSSIVKFTQKLGCRGFTEFKVKMSEEIGREHAIVQGNTTLHNLISVKDSLQEVAQKIAEEKSAAILQTTNNINTDEFKQVVQWLDIAGKVQIAGIGGSALVAKDLSYKLMKIGIPTLNEFDSHVQITIANTLQPKDVFLAFSYSGQRKDILFAAETAKKRGAYVVAITSLAHSLLRDMADCVLTTLAEEGDMRSSSISSRTAQHTIADLLFLSLVQQRDVQAAIQIRDMKGAVDDLSR